MNEIHNSPNWLGILDLNQSFQFQRLTWSAATLIPIIMDLPAGVGPAFSSYGSTASQAEPITEG